MHQISQTCLKQAPNGSVKPARSKQELEGFFGYNIHILFKDCTSHGSSYKLKPVWRSNNISLESKMNLMRSLLISILLYACGSRTLTAELEKKNAGL